MTEAEFISDVMDGILKTGWGQLCWRTQEYSLKKNDFFTLFYKNMLENHIRIFDPETSQNYPEAERILEILLVKFELLSPHKESISVLQKEAISDPSLLGIILFADYKFFHRLWILHHLERQNLISQAKEKATFILSWAAFAVWMTDDGTDLSKTTAFIDRSLSMGTKFLERYGDEARSHG